MFFAFTLPALPLLPLLPADGVFLPGKMEGWDS